MFTDFTHVYAATRRYGLENLCLIASYKLTLQCIDLDVSKKGQSMMSTE